MMDNGPGHFVKIDKTAQEPISPQLHRVTQPVDIAPLAADVDQLGITKREEPLKLIRVGVALVAAMAALTLMSQNVGFSRECSVE